MRLLAFFYSVIGVFFCVLFGIQCGATPLKYSLDDLYQEILAKSETVAIEVESIQQAEARYSQAKSALLPTVNLNASIVRQDEPSAGTARGLSPPDQQNASVTATQPLFRGLREWALLRQQKINVESSELNRQAVQAAAYADLSQIFYQVLMAEIAAENIQRELEINERRFQELQQFRKVGRSRASEVLSVEANIAALGASLEQAKVTIETSRGALALLTAVPRDVPLNDQISLPSQLPSKSNLLEKIDLRPDVRSARQAVDSSEEGIKIARGGHLPSLDLIGNYYLKRPGFLENVKWDVRLALSFPIFQGGLVSSEVGIAASIRKQAELNLFRIQRSASEEITTLIENIGRSLSQVKKLEKAASLNERYFQAEQRDYKNGLVTNFEVLQALTQAQTTKRSLDQVRYQTKMDYLRLLVATAQRPYPNGTKP